MKKKQQGVALITAMLITALASVIAVDMVSRQYIDIRHTANIMEVDQTYLYTLAVETWATQVLRRDALDNNVDHKGEDWATVLPPINISGGQVAGRIEDLQARFNLNNLVEGKIISQFDFKLFQRLLDDLSLERDLAQAVVDWIDPDATVTFPGGGEDSVYMDKTPSYRAANSKIVSISELLLIDGFTQEILTELNPYITALPTRTTININTAEPPILTAIFKNLVTSDAEQLTELIKDTPFNTVAAFFQDDVFKNYNQTTDETNAISVSSQYFIIMGAAQYGRNQMELYSQLTRTNNKTQVIMRGQGAY